MKKQLKDLREKASLFVSSMLELEDTNLNDHDKQEALKIIEEVTVHQDITMETMTP